MNEIQELKNRRDQLLKEADQLHTQMLPFEAALEKEQSIEPAQERELRDKYNDLKTRFDARNHEAGLLDQKINRRETLANCDSLMAGYIEAMNTWNADEQELNEKRQSLSTRLEQIKQRAVEDMAKARQAETDAATAYAQAVAWGDTEGEKTANADAQKAAKNLATAAEHDRRQGLIISALEQELLTVDRYIAESQEKHKGIERNALSHSSRKVLVLVSWTARNEAKVCFCSYSRAKGESASRITLIADLACPSNSDSHGSIDCARPLCSKS
ncbi:hypothetical protein RG931_004655 [Pseudomonas syringae pv. actinidiae]